MKKLILAIALVMTTLTFAQDRKQGREKLTPEQQSELHVKKMTLDLDLDAQQQKEVKTIFLEQAKKREAKMAEMKAKREKGEKPSADERFEMKNEMDETATKKKNEEVKRANVPGFAAKNISSFLIHMLSFIFFARCHASPDMALVFVQIQYQIRK